MKKKSVCALAMLLAALMLAAPAALAETVSMQGTLQPGDIQLIAAPISGSLIDVEIEAGYLIEAGSVMLTVDPVRVYAPCDGVIAGLRAEAGDSLSAAAAIYGAAMYVEPDAEYIIHATTMNAHDSNENRMIHVGETVYLTSTANWNREGVGRVTSVNGESYTVEVLMSNLKLNETCHISREPDVEETEGRIGQGKTQRNNPVAVTGTGSVVKLHVQEGDEVVKGQLLMETAPDALGGPVENAVISDGKYVILSVTAGEGTPVQKGQTVAQAFAYGTLQAVVQATEDDLLYMEVGDEVTVSLDVDPERFSYEGVIEAISYVPVQTAAGNAYEVTVRFENDGFVRMGMSVTVETKE